MSKKFPMIQNKTALVDAMDPINASRGNKNVDKTQDSKKVEKIKNIKDKPVALEKTGDPETEKRKEEANMARQEQIEKIKSELELAIRDYAEIKYKKRKSWENMVGFLGKKDVQEKFDNDSEVLSMKKAYLEKMAEYKDALILDAKEDSEESNDKLGEVVGMILDEIDKTDSAYLNVRKENEEKEFAGKSQETFAKYNKILPPIKETGAHDSDGKEKTKDNLTKKEANGSESEEPNGKEITGNNAAPENAPVNEEPKKHVRSEWEEIMEIMNIEGNTDTTKAAVLIKSSIFGKTNETFFTVIDKNLAEIMNSQTTKEAFLEKIPKEGKTFFNKLIKQVPPKPGDTIKKWIVRVVVEAKKQT